MALMCEELKGLEMRAEALMLFREHEQRGRVRSAEMQTSTRLRLPPTPTPGRTHRTNAADATTNAGADDAVDNSTEPDDSASASVGRKTI